MYFCVSHSLMLRLTLRQLEYVTAIADCGSITEAAMRLHVSQPSLSVALATVEAQIGLPLFIRRKGAPLSLSPHAPAFLERAREVLALAATLEDPRQLHAAGEGRLRLGVFQDLAPQWLPRALAALKAAAPRLQVTPLAADFARLAEDLREGRLDLAISYDLGLDASVWRQVLADSVPHAYVHPAHPLAGARDLSLADLAREQLILFEEGLSIRHMLRLFQEQGLRPLVRHRVATLEIMRSLAAHNEGVGISYTRAPQDLAYDGARVVAVPVRDPQAAEPVVLIRPAGAVAPHQMQAAEIIIAACRQDGPCHKPDGPQQGL